MKVFAAYLEAEVFWRQYRVFLTLDEALIR